MLGANIDVVDSAILKIQSGLFVCRPIRVLVLSPLNFWSSYESSSNVNHEVTHPIVPWRRLAARPKQWAPILPLILICPSWLSWLEQLHFILSAEKHDKRD